MLNDQLQQLVREAGGDALLLDARLHKGLINDADKLIDILKNLRNAGFTRMIDFTAAHLGIAQVDETEYLNKFQLSLVLRAPRFDHAHLVMKWTWPADVGAGLRPAQGGSETRPYEKEKGGQSSASTAAPEMESEAVTVDPELAQLGVAAHAIGPEKAEEETPSVNGDGLPERPEPAEPGYNAVGGIGQPGGQPLQADPVAPHPTLSHIWPAAGLAEREIWEMLGIPFSGHDNLAPLLLDEQFSAFPLRRSFTAPERESYATNLLNERHEQAMLDAVVGATHASPLHEENNNEGGQSGPPHQPKEDTSGGSA